MTNQSGQKKKIFLWLTLFGLGFFLSSQAHAEKSFRVTEYYIAAGAFVGSTYELTLNQDLMPNHIILVQGGANGNVTRGVGDNYARVDQLPAGMNGELGASSGANKIRLARGTTNGNWVGVVTVIESLGDDLKSGFRLLDVIQMYTTGTGTSGTDASGTSWTDMGRVVLFGGAFGSGSNVNDTSANRHTSAWLRFYPSGTNTINWTRVDGGAAGLVTSTHTVYVVQFGSEWTVQKATVTGTNGGNGADVIGEYNTVAITGVERNNTWVWGTGTSNTNMIGNGAEGILVTLGDGVDDTAGNKNTVAVGSEYGVSRTFDVYAMTHGKLIVDYRKKVDGDGTLNQINVTVDTSTNGYRMAWVTNGCNGTTNTFPRSVFSARYTNDTTVQLERGYNGQAFPLGCRESIIPASHSLPGQNGTGPPPPPAAGATPKTGPTTAAEKAERPLPPPAKKPFLTEAAAKTEM